MANHLVNSRSLYLRKHVNNPIDWWYWGDEALAIAKREDKPIFLSIGYSSCHWCTVMEGEAFSDLAIAEYINENFVPIKLDREERPDLDSIYMQALQMMIGQGGWPLNIFLTPDDLVPFYGGTYFPVEPKYGRPGFADILRSINRFYHEEKSKLQEFTVEITSNLIKAVELSVTEKNPLNESLLINGLNQNTGVISISEPSRPAFPMIAYAGMALQGRRWQEQLNYDSDQLVKQRGLNIALGGIYDHVGGGFHRYTVDANWTVPHFEKMLYDNGQIMEYLANLWSAGARQPAFEIAIADTVDWLSREMRSPQGYFYAAQDADSFLTAEEQEPEEGAFYVWSYSELEKLLSSAELAQLQAEFTITPQGNFEGNNVFQKYRDQEISDDLRLVLDRLFAVRYGNTPSEITYFAPVINNQVAKRTEWSGRIPPVTDTKMILAWNSLMVSGLARAYGVFKVEKYRDLAVEAANFIWEQQRREGSLFRLNYDGNLAVLAQSEDYALFIKALLDLHAILPLEPQWLERALEMQTEFDLLFWNDADGGYYNTATKDQKNLLVQERSYLDNATPSANGTALTNLIKLSLLTDNSTYCDRAETGLKAFAGIMHNSPQACPSLFVALDWLLHGNVVKSKAEELDQLLNDYLPTTVLQINDQLPQDSLAIVCNLSSCLEPVANFADLKKLMALN